MDKYCNSCFHYSKEIGEDVWYCDKGLSVKECKKKRKKSYWGGGRGSVRQNTSSDVDQGGR